MNAPPWRVLVAVATVIGGCGGAAPDAAGGSQAVVVRGDLGQRVDSLLTRAADSGFSGSVLVASDTGIILHKGYGWADRARSAPVTPATPFWIASISKQFAAAAILRLAEQGRLSVGDSISRFFPAVASDKQGITLHQLLTHTAGLEQHYAADGITDRDAAVRAILAPPLVGSPGAAFRYSNDAYNLLAAVVEVAAEQPYETFVREQLLEPAGLGHTGFWGPREHPQVAAILESDFPDSTILRPNWGFRGGVGMFSTSGDLYTWYRALQGARVLARSSVDRLMASHLLRGSVGVGYGWFVSRGPGGERSIWTRGYESFGHGAVLATYPDRQTVIVVTSNSGEWAGRPVSHELAANLAQLILAPR